MLGLQRQIAAAGETVAGGQRGAELIMSSETSVWALAGVANRQRVGARAKSNRIKRMAYLAFLLVLDCGKAAPLLT